MRKHGVLVLLAIALLAAAPAFASGFAFYEQGANASAQGGAWVARANDAAANWYNPAALVHLEGRELQIGLNYLDIGSDTRFTPAGGGSTFDAVSNVETPAHFYFAQKINDRVAWGVGLNNPFGLVSEWEDLPLTLSSKRAELRTFLFNPNIAFKFAKHWSLAFGADYLSAEVRDFSRDDLNPLIVGANLTGEGDAWGYNIALQFKIDRFSIAGHYRSEMTPEINGRIRFAGPLAPVLDSDASTSVSLPGQTFLGAAWTGERFDVEIGGYQTQWNGFRQLFVDTGNPATSVTLIEKWEATWSYRIGAAFRLGEALNHEIRIGGVLDESPVPAAYLRPSIPDSDRTGYTAGYGWQGKRVGIDVYVMQMDFDDAVANGSLADAVINGTYESSIFLAGATFKYRF